MELGAWYAEARATEDPDPFAYGIVRGPGGVAGMFVYEPYDAVGGPDPYHDAVVYAIFVRPDAVNRVFAACVDAAGALGEGDPVVVEGSVDPPSWFQRLRMLFG